MNISKLLLITPIILAPAFLASCNKAPPSETLFSNSIELSILAGTSREADCKVDHVFETSKRNIECVIIDFPAGMEDPDEKERHALDLTRKYADLVSAKGWLAEPIGDYIVNFEKPISDECSKSLQLMTWVVDEGKPVAERRFPSTRFTFIEKHEPACGAERFITP